jgi:uncharacterized protein (DUF362 family)
MDGDDHEPTGGGTPTRSWTARLAAAVVGLAALAWLLLRSGTRPTRLAYPCQQAAASAAVLALGAPTAAAALAARRGLARHARLLILLVGLGLATAAFGSWLEQTGALSAPPPLPPLSAPDDYRAEVFHMADCPQDPDGDRFPGLDELIAMMGAHGTKFFRSDVTSLTAGPEGILGANDVVAIKINYQWDERGGTNTDVLRGLIARILDHPEGFTGEVVVVENAQFKSTEGFDRPHNNAEDIAQSPHDVVAHFRDQGHRISLFDWTPIRFDEVSEYDQGDLRDGYVVYPWDPQLVGRPSYPKFRTEHGTYVSLMHGVWDQAGGTYDRERLKLINVPVLKSHHSTYGATAMVKNYMGVVTRELGTYSHTAIRYGILGEVVGMIQPADLNLLDCIWINADPYTGPATSYEGATRRDSLVASLDPIAGDMWAVKNVLIPGFHDNGFTPPWPSPSADPDDPNSDFRQYLDASMNRILAAGYTVTNDLEKVDLRDLPPPGEASDPSDPGAPLTIAKHPDGFELSWSAPTSGGSVDRYKLYRTNLTLGLGRAQPECEAELGTGTSAVLATLSDQCGFLVVGRNRVGDGSFGSDQSGAERPSPEAGSVCP